MSTHNDPSPEKRAVQAASLIQQGVERHQMGDHEGAIDSLLDALRVLEPTSDIPAQALTWHHLGTVRYAIGNLRDSYTAFAKARELALAAGDEDRAAHTLGNMGLIQSDLGVSV